MTPVAICPRESTINRIEYDMYFSTTDKGPMTLRVLSLEATVERMEHTKEARDARMERKFNIILGAVLASVGALVLDLIFKR